MLKHMPSALLCFVISMLFENLFKIILFGLRKPE
jgi:hypothetical protein